MNYRKRLLEAIPGGAHTYSRGFDQFPENAPDILLRGKGAYVYDDKEKKFLDYGMGLRSVNIGYAETEIDNAAFAQMSNGNNLTRPSLIELEAAELMIQTIDSVEMVKFCKNGSSAVTAAVKLARAYTGRSSVAICNEHPFFSYDDWFIGSTPIKKGIPESALGFVKRFNYNDIKSVESLVDEFKNDISCIILEPATSISPEANFLQKIRDICNKNGIVLIFDEMITGFRWHLKGAQYVYGVQPDLSTFGKAMANGYSVSCVGGRREIMSLGSTEKLGQERTFLLSSTHGGEMSSLGAFVATVAFIQKNQVIKHNWDFGSELIEMMNSQAREFGVESSFKVFGTPCSPQYVTLDEFGNISLELRTVFAQEMINNGVIMPWISLCYRHGESEMELTRLALKKSFEIYKKALNSGIDDILKGAVIKPVFRKYN